VGCILSPDSGAIELLGQDVTRFGPRDQAKFRRNYIGFVFQRFHLFRGLTASENVRVPLNLIGQSTVIAQRECLRLLEAVGIADKAHSPISQLSMGQRQRVALARALAADPELILADEPTASLDASSGLKAMNLLRDLTKRMGKTVVVVTHDSRILPLADRILQLEDGRVKSNVHTSVEACSGMHA
jgi:putative ABC transport system ATP-binding protein